MKYCVALSSVAQSDSVQASSGLKEKSLQSFLLELPPRLDGFEKGAIDSRGQLSQWINKESLQVMHRFIRMVEEYNERLENKYEAKHRETNSSAEKEQLTAEYQKHKKAAKDMLEKAKWTFDHGFNTLLKDVSDKI